ncbi:glutathione S-transferase family protein [Aestuariivirga sp.]|uniref:glutathione S-transferase family protein n=1 Tax=Aestuariivirga sp. TaxID=2650926 RepID=UPI00359469CD
MSVLHLIIGNKNYSSWSLRPWMALSMAGIPFRETVIPLDTADTARLIAEHSRAGRVPVLRHGRATIWESLAIMEYLAELFPEKNLWPKAASARAMARCVSNEMHAGFSALQNACPMNLRRPRKPVPFSDAVMKDVGRIEEIWHECRVRHGKGGKFLFGKFSIADAMFAPVVTRFDTFMVPVASETRAYMDTVMNTEVFRSWREAALKEEWIVPADEVD